MSVLIRGMEMPKNCSKCVCLNRTVCGTIWKSLTAIWLDSEPERRPNWCPLIEVPEPHGRLIDADKLIANHGEWYTEEGTEEGFIGTIKNLVEFQPIVIEAEGGD